MEKESDFEKEIEKTARLFLEKTKNKEILVISHYDTDGITSAAIMIKTLKSLDRKFSIRIIKSMEEKIIKNLPENKVIIFLDLASGSLNYIADSKLEDIFIIDHHEITQKIPENVSIINPKLTNKKEDLSSSCLTYLFCKKINNKDRDLAKLAVVGMIGDLLEKNINKLNNKILEDGEVIKKRGLLLYPSTRPINKVLEYSSNPYIPGITGNLKGIVQLMREAKIELKNGKYPSLIELDDEEMKRLTTAVLLRIPHIKSDDFMGDIFLIKLFNKLEDAREISAMINACSRLGESNIAIQLCLESDRARQNAKGLYAKYRKFIISGLDFVANSEKIEGKNYVIINAKDKIKDTIIGTIASILSNSNNYDEGTIITAMAYYDDKIKISSRCVGRNGKSKNVREILADVIEKTGGEVGGHEYAAGAIIHQNKESEFLENLQKVFEIEKIKI